MAMTKRVQVLMEPAEFKLLERVARERGSSVADLMRQATRAQFLTDVDRSRRTSAVQSFLSLPDAALPDWESLKHEIENRYGDDVS